MPLGKRKVPILALREKNSQERKGLCRPALSCWRWVLAFLQPGALGGDAGNGTNITVLIGPESAYILKFGSMHPLEGPMKRVGENKSFHIAPQPATTRQFAGKVQRDFLYYLEGRRHTAVCCAQFMLLFLRWLYVALACPRRQDTRHSADAHGRVRPFVS